MHGGPGTQIDRERPVCSHDVVEKQYPNNWIKSDLEKLRCSAAFLSRLSGALHAVQRNSIECTKFPAD